MLDTAERYRHVAGAVYQVHQGPVYLVALGPDYEGKAQDWSFRHLSRPENAQADSALTRHLPAIARQMGVHDIFVPSPVKSNTVVTRPSELRSKIAFGEREGWPVTVWRGVEADAIILKPGETTAISVGGCEYITVLHEPSSTLGVAHGSRSSLIDEGRLLGRPPRRYESVVVSLLAAMGISMERAHEARVTIFFPIPAKRFEHSWDHPEFGARNENRSRFLYESYGEAVVPGWKNEETRRRGRIDLGEVAVAQFAQMGVPENAIDIVKAPERNWADTRGSQAHLRNLVLIRYS
ncbi:MAG TPA: hypothetical protein VG934_00200 [Candidatus Paceibacterota bacterium]|nr:hypothetical protein [Candidatus Paceibacterota bacterium]